MKPDAQIIETIMKSTPSPDPSQSVVFIDLDGVFNVMGCYEWATRTKSLILPCCVDNFNHLIEQSGAKLVLSSSWRHVILSGYMTVRGFEYLLRSHGLRGELVGHTCHDDEHDTRGEQIRAWRRSVKHTGRYVVLDDMDDGISDCGHPAVFTNGAVGLTRADAEKALGLLLGPSTDCAVS